MNFVVIFAKEGRSGPQLGWGGVYPDFRSCCSALQLSRGMVYHIHTGYGIEISDALDLYHDRLKASEDRVTVHIPFGCFWATRSEWYKLIGENAPDVLKG